MTENIFSNADEEFPVLSPAFAMAHRLRGTVPQDKVEPQAQRDGITYLKGCEVLQTSLLSPELAGEVAATLTDKSNYGDRGFGARCFFPGFGFTFGEGAEAVVVLVCLECSWVVLYTAGGRQSVVPNPSGAAKLRSLYERLMA